MLEFDTERGLGVLEAQDGARLVFHCTQIADGSRTVAPGVTVGYQVVPGRLGTWEAVALEAR